MKEKYHPGDLAIHGTVSEIVQVYNREMTNIRAAYTTLHQAGENLTQAFGKVTDYSSINALPERCYSVESTLKEVELKIRATCWSNLIARLGVRKVLSVKRNEELSKRLSEKEKLPEITVQEVFSLFETLTENANDFMKEAIQEAYQFLHVTPGYSGSAYKTNQRNAFEDIGKKVIITGCIENGWGHDSPFRVNRYDTDKLRALDRVFHALDEKQFTDSGYQSPLIDAINTSHGGGSTEYFRFQCYHNGNLHLEFTRPDLLRLFNRYANDGTALKSGHIF